MYIYHVILVCNHVINPLIVNPIEDKVRNSSTSWVFRLLYTENANSIVFLHLLIFYVYCPFLNLFERIRYNSIQFTNAIDNHLFKSWYRSNKKWIRTHIADTFEPNFFTISMSCEWSFRTLRSLSLLDLLLSLTDDGNDVMKASSSIFKNVISVDG